MKRTAVLLVLGLLVSCSGAKTSDNATTAGPTEAGPTSSASGLGIDKYVSRPCDILTPDQVAKLGAVKPGEPGAGTLGPLCTWDGQDVIANSQYTVSLTKDKDVADMVRNVSGNPVFKDTEVDGLRFVTNSQTDGKIRCVTIVGLSADESFTVQAAIAADERATKSGCTESESVAKMIIANLRA